MKIQKDCLICNRISQIKYNKNKYFVAELETGYVVIGDFQFFEGYALLLCKQHVRELHELEPKFKTKFLEEMSIVAEAVYQAFKPEKLNYELLGNSDDFHLHWHIFPRYNDDPRPEGPVWWIDRDIRCNENTRPSNKDLTVYKKKLLKELDKIMSNKK